jgi:hypothetical protein
LAGLIVTGRWLGLVLGLALGGVAYMSPLTSPVGRSVEQMFGAQDAAVADYQAIKQIFGDRETILIVYRDRELFASHGRGLDRLAQLSREVGQLDQVAEVLSLDRSLARFGGARLFDFTAQRHVGSGSDTADDSGITPIDSGYSRSPCGG